MPWVTVYFYKHLGSHSALWHCFIYWCGHSLSVPKEASCCCSSPQVDFWAKLQVRLPWWVQTGQKLKVCCHAGQVTSWPFLQSRCLLQSHLSWAPFAASGDLRAWATHSQNTWTVPYRTYFPPLAIKTEWVTYQHLKRDAIVATPGPVLSEHHSAAEIWEGFQFTGNLGRFPFHVDVRLKLASEKN